MRNPEEIIINEKKLKGILQNHKESIKQQKSYCVGFVDCIINQQNSERELLEEEIFKDFTRVQCDYNTKLENEIFELGLSVLYKEWLKK